ncbi:MAG: PorP/SprF family type IX secretion system membrane protein [Flavobacteriaceae bacterium]|nr:PorP/SprF family type IX secretion system membrane protein [Flavobacteriaceae bacterium]
MNKFNKDKSYKKIYFLILISILFCGKSFSQQELLYSQYVYNMNVINPAYSGSKKILSATLLSRTQLDDYGAGSSTYLVSMNSPILKNMGVGFSILSNKVGPSTEREMFADFAYTISISNDHKLALGVKVGAIFSNIDYLSLGVIDPALQENVSVINPNFGVGLYYYGKNFYVGISAPTILEIGRLGSIVQETATYVSKNTNLYFSAGYVFKYGRDYKIKPFTLLSSTASSSFSVELGTNVMCKDKIEFGASYRYKNSYSLMASMEVSENFRIGYAYDKLLNDLEVISPTSHELFVIFNLKNDRYVSPRFF